MNETSKKYIPLSEVRTDRISSSLNLPYDMESRVGLNVRKMENIMQLGGISQALLANTRGRYGVRIAGISGSGTALGTVTSVTTSEYESSERQGNVHNSKWTDIKIFINSDGILQKLRNDNDQKPDKADKWASELNQRIKIDLLKAGNRQLLKMDGADVFNSLLFYPIMAVVKNSVSTDLFRNMPNYLYFLFTNLALNFFLIRKDGVESQGYGTRLTLMPLGPELDRALILNLYSLGKPLIANLENIK